MRQLKQVTYTFEFILAAHMVFSLIVELQSVLFPITILQEAIDELPPWKRPKYPHANHNELFDFISFFGFCVWLALKYFIEGFRFNTIIVCFAELTFFLDRALQFADKVLCQVSFMLTVFYIMTLITHPVYEFPEPTGPYKVGYRSMRIEDGFISQAAVFYPCEDPEKANIPPDQKRRMQQTISWAPDPKYVKQIYEYIISRQWVPYPEWVIDFTIGFLQQKMSNQQFKCLVNPRVTTEEEKFPVIIFSHGLTGHKHSSQTYAQQWASLGYIVICPQHYELVWPWDDKSNKIFWKKNKEHIIERYKKIRGAHIDWRVEQMSALINQLYVPAKVNEIFQQEIQIDLDSIIVAGHQLGGVSALRISQVDKRVKGVIAIDPWMFPLTKEKIEKKIETVPVLLINQEKEPEKDEIYDPQDLKLLLESNKDQRDQFLAYKMIGMDEHHPSDISYLLSSELKFANFIRRNDNLQVIQLGICQMTHIFINNFVMKNLKLGREKGFKEPLEDWSRQCLKTSKLLKDLN